MDSHRKYLFLVLVTQHETLPKVSNSSNILILYTLRLSRSPEEAFFGGGKGRKESLFSPYFLLHFKVVRFFTGFFLFSFALSII